MNPYYAYALRAVATGVFFANGILLAAVAAGGQPDVLVLELAALTGIQGALTYLGIGAVSKTLEPDVGIRKA